MFSDVVSSFSARRQIATACRVRILILLKITLASGTYLFSFVPCLLLIQYTSENGYILINSQSGKRDEYFDSRSYYTFLSPPLLLVFTAARQHGIYDSCSEENEKHRLVNPNGKCDVLVECIFVFGVTVRCWLVSLPWLWNVTRAHREIPV